MIGLEQELDEMLQQIGPADVPCSKIKVEMINKIKNLEYVAFADFMVDLTEYLQEVRIRYRDHPELARYKAIWVESLQLLKADHWRKYDFEAETELSKFDS